MVNVEDSFRGSVQQLKIWKVYYTDLEKVKANIIAKIKQFLYFSQSNICEDLAVLKTVRR